ncbi:MAG: sugar phosphate nucleotidyltransferase [Oscillospiraceae bacterium]|nr:sugar phosphate nucleotidyltransferase [Oscillospiraceae bacterium]
MKAVIMAGGEGTRLRPLTLKMPKPLVPILGESVISYIIRLLKKHNVSDAAITLMFLPEQIKDKYKNNFEGVNLAYFEEDKPLGTAGSVKNTQSFLLDKNIKSHDDFFIVISGDAVCDIDISKAVEFHRQSESDVTLVLTESENPLEFGGVLTETRDSGTILTFIEKPSWSQVFTDTINTGIYIINNKVLESVPENKFYDFGKDLFPFLLNSNGKYKLSGYVDNNYWCDIGDLDAYYNCNIDAADGKIKIINETAKMCMGGHCPSVKMTQRPADGQCPPILSKYSIIGKNCEIGENCEIIDSIIHDGVKIGNNTKIIKSIVCQATKIGDNVVINDGCVVGQECVIENYAFISKGVKIWNNKKIYEREKIMSNVIFSNLLANKRSLFDSDDGITGIFNETLTPEYCVKIGAAAGIASSDFKNKRPGRIGVMYSQSVKHQSNDAEYKYSTKKNNISRLIKDSLLCGVVASGAKSYDFGEGFDSLAAFAAGHFRLDTMLFVDRIISPDGSYNDVMKIFDYNTLSPSRPFERKFDAALSRDDYKPPVANELYDTETFEGLQFLYFSELLKNAGRISENPTKLSGLKVAVKSKNANKTGTAAHILKKALIELSCEVYDDSDDLNNHNTNNGEITDYLNFAVSDDGFYLQAYDNSINGAVDFWHIVAVLIKDAIHSGETEIAMPYLAPHALQIITENEGADILRYISCPFDDDGDDLKAKSKIISQFYLKDACFAAVKLCHVLYSSGKSLGWHIKELPEFTSRDTEIYADDSKKTKIMHILNAQLKNPGDLNCVKNNENGEKKKINYRAREGIQLDFSNGFVNVVPKKSGGFKLIAEAVSTEAAEELLDVTNDRIQSIIDGIDKNIKNDNIKNGT